MSAGDPIALFLPNLAGGGAERILVRLAGEFAARGHAVDLLVASATGDLAVTVSERVRLVELGGGGVLRALLPLAAHLRRRRPAALLSTLDHANVVAIVAAKLSGTRVRVLVREAAVATKPSGRRLPARALPALKRLAYPRADLVIAVSRAVADSLVDGMGLAESSVRVVGNPVVTADFAARCGGEAPHPWFGEGVPVVLGVGRLVDQKDFGTLLDAVALLRTERRVRLMILGSGPRREALLARARELGIASDVELPGFVPDAVPYMAAADVFALTSRYEGLPGVLIEALACGCPVVATDCPGGSAEVLGDGRFGTLVPVGDAESIARALAEQLDRPLPPAEVRRGAAPYSVDGSVAAYLDLLAAPTGERSVA